MLHVKAFKANYRTEHISFFSRDDIIILSLVVENA